MKDELKTNKANINQLKSKRVIKEGFIEKIYETRTIKVILGPEDDRFTENGIKTFFSSMYKLCADSDRMGYRISGEKIEQLEEVSIDKAIYKTYTSSICPGYAQVNLVILPKKYAHDFLVFAFRNPKACPILAIGEMGEKTVPKCCEDSDIYKSIPRYNIFENGELKESISDAMLSVMTMSFLYFEHVE